MTFIVGFYTRFTIQCGENWASLARSRGPSAGDTSTNWLSKCHFRGDILLPWFRKPSVFPIHFVYVEIFVSNLGISQCEKVSTKWPISKMCEQSELVNNSQLSGSFSPTRHLTVELSQPKPKLDWKTSKMTHQFCRQNRSINNHILGKI